MYDMLWFAVMVQTQPITRERQREFERELENHIGFGGLKAIIRSFMPW